MKKITLILVLVLISVSISLVGFLPTATAETNYDLTQKQEYTLDREIADKILFEFTDSYVDENEELIDMKDRTATSDGEKHAAKYVAKKFYEFGLVSYKTKGDLNETFNQNDYVKDVSFYTSTDGPFISKNVIGMKKSSKQGAKNVYIGAHIDNYYGAPTINNEMNKSTGAYDNGTGVATMLAIAEAIKDLTFDFNIVFIGFGAEEPGYYGSQDFVDNLSASEVEDALLMINLDSIGAGDKLYLYTYEGETYHERFMKQVADKKSVNINSMPKRKDVSYGIQLFDDISYSHVGMESDHRTFYNSDILVANFFSYNLDGLKWKESNSHDNIMHTSKDTYDILNEYYGAVNSDGEKEYLAKMNGVADIVLSSLTATDFEKMLLDSKANLPNLSIWNKKWIYFVIGGSVLLISIGAVMMVYYSQKKKYQDEPITIEETNASDNIEVFGSEFESKPNDKNDDLFDDF